MHVDASRYAKSGSWVRSVVAVLRRPDLWPTALRLMFTLAPTRWWTRPPFLPTPDRAYWHFRATTAYGDTQDSPSPKDTITYLEWCRSWNSTQRSSGQ